MKVRVHTGDWFTGHITAFGACCALLFAFAFRSSFDETRSLREILVRWRVRRLYTDSCSHFKSFFDTFSINFSYRFALSECYKTAPTVVDIPSADSETTLTAVKPLSAGSDAALTAVKPLSAGSDAALTAVKPLSADSDAALTGFKPLSADSDAIFVQLNISNKIYNTQL